LTVTCTNSSTNCVDVRWSSSTPSLLTLGSSSQQSFYLVSVRPSDSAAGHGWTVVVRNSTTSELRFDLNQSGIVGTPLVTVRRCRVTRSVLGDERWSVDSAAGSDAYDPLAQLLSRLSFSPKPTSPSGDDFIDFIFAVLDILCLHSHFTVNG